MEVNINNKIYNISYHTDDNGDIFVENFSINPQYQGRHRNYSKRIFENIIRQHKGAEILYLECMPDLIKFYEKCGFVKWSNSPNWWGGYEMHLYRDSIQKVA